MEALLLTYEVVEFTLNQLVKTETPVPRITRAIEAYVAMEARAALRHREVRELRKRKAQEKAAAFKHARVEQVEIEAAVRIFTNLDDWTIVEIPLISLSDDDDNDDLANGEKVVDVELATIAEENADCVVKSADVGADDGIDDGGDSECTTLQNSPDKNKSNAVDNEMAVTESTATTTMMAATCTQVGGGAVGMEAAELSSGNNNNNNGGSNPQAFRWSYRMRTTMMKGKPILK